MEQAKQKSSSFLLHLKRLWHGFAHTMKLIYHNKKAFVGLLIMLFFIFMMLFLTKIFPYDDTPHPEMIFAPVSAEHWLGTDELGRDLFRRIIAGSPSVLSIAFQTGLYTIVLGVLIGMISGLAGGWVDRILNMLMNLFMTVPSFPIMLALATMITITNTTVFALLLSAWGWASLARAIRSQIISIKERDFIQICKVMNMSKAHIIFKELMPNIASYIVVNFIMIMRNAITSSVGIMMLGVVAYDHTNWGAILNSVQSYIMNPQALLFCIMPIVFIGLFQAGVILLSNGLDEVLNPRLRVS